MRRPNHAAAIRRQVDADLARLRSRPGANGGKAGQSDAVEAALEHLDRLQRKGRARIAKNAELLESLLREEGRQTSTVKPGRVPAGKGPGIVAFPRRPTSGTS